ncbi:MAG: CGNR zinc finger domain-containing protein [Thermocrispum sp.]
MELGARMISGPDGQRWRFDPGSLSLELLLTGGPAEFQRPETLRTPMDLVGWLAESRLARPAPIYPQQVQVRPSDLRRIKELRDAVWRVVVATARGDDPETGQLELINGCAQDAVRPELELTTAVLRWAPMTGAQVLGTIARDVIELVGSGNGRLRECQGENCSLLFVDTSRPGNRRWCSMRRCGNRQKVRAFRRRAASQSRAGGPAGDSET